MFYLHPTAIYLGLLLLYISVSQFSLDAASPASYKLINRYLGAFYYIYISRLFFSRIHADERERGREKERQRERQRERDTALLQR